LPLKCAFKTAVNSVLLAQALVFIIRKMCANILLIYNMPMLYPDLITLNLLKFKELYVIFMY
jgi:hypothetical protein